MAVVVGLVLGAASVISLVTQWADGAFGVFGIFAANGPTTLAWGAVAAALLLSALLPRIGRGREDDDDDRTGVVAAGPATVHPPPVATQADRRRRPVREGDPAPAAPRRRVVAPADGDGPDDHGRVGHEEHRTRVSGER